MVVAKRLRLFGLLLMIVATLQHPRDVGARPIAVLHDHQGLPKMFATLGVVCKCCDDARGECRSTWDASCPKLQCLPWKFH